ncbi:porin [Polaromonas jejuensis]|uniref:Porin n=1 Tax=Polaromonas jejuensis TaxID=457502 RepID=A0ABW0Q9W8_9BURK|nr:porin [Polaromonas jejuensis]
MKKNLIGLAVLAASGVASAQSTVTLYGLADVYFGSNNTKKTVAGVSNSLRQTVVDSGGFNTSRFGLKGSEDLGGGLKANFVLESGFKIDTGAVTNYTNPFTGVDSPSTFSRNSWVGLSGGFGEVRLGKMWTPFDEVKGSGAAAFDANIFAPAANVWLSNSYQDRPGNAIYYATPTFSGFSGAAMYSFGENKTATQSAGKIASFNVQYAGGPVAAALSYQTEKQGGTFDANPTTKFTQLNGSYDFGVVKLLGAYGHVKDGSIDLFGTGSVRVDKATEYQIGLDVPVGSAFIVSGGYAHSKLTTPAGDVKSNGIGLAGKYVMSKRTFLYAGLQLSKNDAGAAGELKKDTYAVGIQHKF